MKIINKKVVLSGVFLLISLIVFLLINYRTSNYEIQKNQFYETIYQESKKNFENIKIFRVLNSTYSDVYIKSNYENDSFIKVDHEWMKKRIFGIVDTKNKYDYKITSLNPLNPENKANDFEVRGLNYFIKNEKKNYYFEKDNEKKKFDFIAKLTVEQSCINCHSGYKLGEVRGGISVTIPALIYESNLKNIEVSYKIEVSIIFVLGISVFIISWFIMNKIYKNQERLKNMKNQYKDMYDRYDYAVTGAELGLWDWNLTTNQIYFSKVWKNMLGYKDEEIENELEFWDKNVHPEDKNKAYEDILNNQNKKTKFYENIHRLKHKDGSWVWILDKGRTIFDKNGKAIRMIGFHTNITKIQNLKEELEHKEEMMIAQSRHAAMGEMISMIAHQWRQPISVIGMACNNILIDIELEMLDTEQLRDNTESMLEQTKYLSQTIEDFRNFFRPNKEKEIINPKVVVDETLSIMSKSFENNNIQIKFDTKEDCRVNIYSRELLQVFLNILKNAKESFENKNIETKIIEISIKKIDENVRIQFFDNAGIIDDSIKDKIFEPYFSTKDEKTGTGLGLYMSKTIVEKHLNGKFGFYNTQDGVVFYVDLEMEKNS